MFQFSLLDAPYYANENDACYKADSRLAPNQWETSLQSNAVSHPLGSNLESALYYIPWNMHCCNGDVWGFVMDQLKFD